MLEPRCTKLIHQPQVQNGGMFEYSNNPRNHKRHGMMFKCLMQTHSVERGKLGQHEPKSKKDKGGVILHLRFRTVQHWYSRSRSTVPRRSAPSATRWARPETSKPCRQWTPSESTSLHRGVEAALRGSPGSCCAPATCSNGRSLSAAGSSDMAATAPRDRFTSMPPRPGEGALRLRRRRRLVVHCLSD